MLFNLGFVLRVLAALRKWAPAMIPEQMQKVMAGVLSCCSPPYSDQLVRALFCFPLFFSLFFWLGLSRTANQVLMIQTMDAGLMLEECAVSEIDVRIDVGRHVCGL